MKGLFLSLVLFIAYVISTTLIAHVFKPNRHAKLFVPAFLAWSPLYFLVFLLTPPDLWFISPAWQADPAWIDLLAGYVAFALNVHSFMDFFFGFNGGFSTSILLNIFRAKNQTLSTQQIIQRYCTPDGSDKITGWRLPRLQDTGYLVIHSDKAHCSLTRKGHLIASFSAALKKILNLGSGG